jgi:hypothetical protein
VVALACHAAAGGLGERPQVVVDRWCSNRRLERIRILGGSLPVGPRLQNPVDPDVGFFYNSAAISQPTQRKSLFFMLGTNVE